MKKFYSLLVICFLVVGVGFTLYSCGGSSDESSGGITLKLASDAPEEHIATGLNNDLCKMIEEKTDGRVKVKYYPASQLGSYESVYKELMQGTVDIGQMTAPDVTDKKLGAAYLPFYALNYEEAKTLYGKDSYMVKIMKDSNEANDISFIGFCLEGFIGMGTTKEPTDVNTPGTNKKFKMRSPGMATFLKVQEDMGYQPTTVTYAEVPTAIQTGVVEGWIGGTPNMNYSWVGDIIKYMYVNYIHAEATSYLISNKTLAKVGEEDAAIIKECIQAQSEKSFTLAQENEEKYKKKLADEKNVKVVEWSEKLKQTFADYIRKVTWPKLAKEFGKDTDGKDVIEQFKAELAKLKG